MLKDYYKTPHCVCHTKICEKRGGKMKEQAQCLKNQFQIFCINTLLGEGVHDKK